MTTSSPRASMAVWSEGSDFQFVRSLLPQLKRLTSGLFQAVHESELDNDELYVTWEAALKLGVAFRPWLLLSEKQGYWANKHNAGPITDLVMLFLEKARARGLSPEWITLDLEPRPELQRKLGAALQSYNLLGLWRILKDEARDGSFWTAHAAYRALVVRLRAEGIKVHAVVMPFLLHDRKNRNYRVQNVLGVPIRGIDWDQVSFMVYRAEIIHRIGHVGPDIVYLYAKRATECFGSRAALGLGEVGEVKFPERFMAYTNFVDLNNDVAAARAGGISAVHIYSLDGLAGFPNEASSWFSLPEPKRPPWSFRARAYVRLLDVVAALLPEPKAS